MSRELLRRWLIDFGKVHPDVELMKNTQEYLAQPEPETNKDLINDIDYLITAFEDGADAGDYWGDIINLRHDLNKFTLVEAQPESIDLLDADCENCKYNYGSYAEYPANQHCYMFKESPGNKCGQFKIVSGVENE